MGKFLKNAHSVEFAKGGTTKMFGKGVAAPAVAGQSGKDSNGGPDAKFAAGGKTHMFGKGHANQAPSGVSIKDTQ
jgi:hypothetical protein